MNVELVEKGLLAALTILLVVVIIRPTEFISLMKSCARHADDELRSARMKECRTVMLAPTGIAAGLVLVTALAKVVVSIKTEGFAFNFETADYPVEVAVCCVVAIGVAGFVNLVFCKLFRGGRSRGRRS